MDIFNEPIEKFKKKIDELLDSKDFIKYLEDIAKQEKEGLAYVGTRQYFTWLTNEFLLKFKEHCYDNEAFLYSKRDRKKDFSEKDIKNEGYVGYVSDFLELVRKEQRAQKDNEFSLPFEGVKYCFQFNNKKYLYLFMEGQGIAITIREATKDETFKRNINLDKYFKKV